MNKEDIVYVVETTQEASPRLTNVLTDMPGVYIDKAAAVKEFRRRVKVAKGLIGVEGMGIEEDAPTVFYASGDGSWVVIDMVKAKVQ